jgi:RimJ/RimL family protein N-acetyltransferase
VIEDHRILRGDKVVLRPLASGDLRRCVKWFSDPDVLRFLGRSGGVSLAEEERWFRDYERRTDEQIFAIETGGRHIGNLGLHRVDRVHQKADMGIVIGEPDFWSHGFGSDAIRAALRYGFSHLGLNKISLDVLEYNVRAIRSYEKCGFQKEGVHREEVYKDGRFFNVLRMSILAREFSDPPAHMSAG